MPSFYPFFDALLEANVLQATLLIIGWFMLGVAIVLFVWRPLHGLPREDISYADLLRR
jgi:NADH-quinone oxidoreductase subunit L